MRWRLWLLLSLLLAGFAAAQESPLNSPTIKPRREPSPSTNSRKPQQEQEQQPNGDTSGMSSSKSTKGDLSAPAGDANEHPGSDVSNTTETHPWNPHRADKDVEVGDYHFKNKNYRAAESRYREALYFQDNNAAAMFGLAATLEKENKRDEAVQFYTQYLKTLPGGVKAPQA